MKRLTLAAVLAVGGLLAVTATAAADIGDVNYLEVDDPLFGDASSVEVTGQIRCQGTIDYGLIGGVAQDYDYVQGDGPPQFFTFLTTDTVGETMGGDPANSVAGAAGPNADAEGVGAFGPEFGPPEGISDDSPCSQALQSFDIVIQQNRDSGDFEDGPMGVILMAASSAEDGDRGPGPFIADMLIDASEPEFERTR